MIVSNNPNRSNSRWLQVCVLLGTVLALPFGVAIAQDYDAVGRRLRAAVQAGELTGEQARAMLGTLRKAGDAGKDQSSDRAKASLMKVREDLGAAVKDGKISREVAAKKYKAAEKRIRERMAAGQRQDDSKCVSRKDGEGIRKRIEGAVERGDMTREEADAKYREIKKRISQKNNRNEVDWDAIKRRVEGAVERGDMTREEADAKYREIRERMASSDRGDGLRARYAAVAEEIRAAVEAGEITEEQGKAKLEGLKKRLAQEAR